MGSTDLTRRNFLLNMWHGLLVLALPLALPRRLPAAPAGKTSPGPAPVAGVGSADLCVATGKDPDAITRAAVSHLGGMGRFVSKGNWVIVKPNIGWNRTERQAANTNPDVVASLVTQAREAGAGRVTVFDYTCNPAPATYARSGIAAAAEKAGAEVVMVDMKKFVLVEIEGAEAISRIEIYKDIREADLVINVPVAKVHSLSTLTLGMKNLLGVVKDRPAFHDPIHKKLPDLLSVVKPGLTVLDAVRILTAHGPSGGNLKDVKRLNKVIAGADAVAVDAYGATLFGMQPADLGFIANAARRGMGVMDLGKLKVTEC